jgi:hypothetical protein
MVPIGIEPWNLAYYIMLTALAHSGIKVSYWKYFHLSEDKRRFNFWNAVCIEFALDDGHAQHNCGVTITTNIWRSIAFPPYLNVTLEELCEGIFCILQLGWFLYV